jgi:hypothetical protein
MEPLPTVAPCPWLVLVVLVALILALWDFLPVASGAEAAAGAAVVGAPRGQGVSGLDLSPVFTESVKSLVFKGVEMGLPWSPLMAALAAACASV